MKDTRKKEAQDNNIEDINVHEAVPCVSRRDFLILAVVGAGALLATRCDTNIESIPSATPSGLPPATEDPPTPVPSKTPEVKKTPTPTEVNIDFLRTWGSEVMGESGVPHPESLVGVAGVGNLVIEKGGSVADKGQDYNLQAGEEKLTSRVLSPSTKVNK
jgi:hypothetical protein